MTKHFPALLAQSCSHVSGGRCGSPFHPSPQRAQWTFCSPLFPEQLSQESAELLWGAGEKAAGPPAGPRWRGQAEVGWVSPAAADKGLPGPAPRRGAKGLQLLCPGCAGPWVSYQRLRTRLLAFAQCRPACGGEPGPAGHTACEGPRLQGTLESSML